MEAKHVERMRADVSEEVITEVSPVAAEVPELDPRVAMTHFDVDESDQRRGVAVSNFDELRAPAGLQDPRESLVGDICRLVIDQRRTRGKPPILLPHAPGISRSKRSDGVACRVHPRPAV